jgi:ribonuclease-3
VKNFEKKVSLFLYKNKIYYNNLRPYLVAFTHKSYVYDNQKNFPDSKKQDYYNERLEFLGDAILNFLIAEYLFENYPDYSEDILTAIKSNIISDENLYEIGIKLGIYDIILLGQSIKIRNPLYHKNIVSNVVEALIGAIYVDLGLEEVRKFIFFTNKDIFLKNMFVKEEVKAKLQALIQEYYNETPKYFLILEKKSNDKMVFLSGVSFLNKFIAYGRGYTKKEAEKNAAKNALKKLGKLLF